MAGTSLYVESVTEGIRIRSATRFGCDPEQILTHDPEARVACETCASTGLVHIMGEITTQLLCGLQEKIVRDAVADIGYTPRKVRL